MSPRHVTPLVALGVILVEEVVGAVGEDQSVGVVDPVLGGGIVYLRAVELVSARRQNRRALLGLLLLGVVDERVVILLRVIA